MATLRQVTAMAKDLYFQNYKPDDAYFDEDHFKFLLVNKFVQLISEESRNNKRENKQLYGYYFIEISADWLITEILDVQKDKITGDYYVTPKRKFFPFDYDAMGSAVQNVRIIGDECGDVKRISSNDRWMTCMLPVTAQHFYYVAKDKVVILNSQGCKAGKIELQYVPNLTCEDDEAEIHEDKVSDMIESVLNLMFGARQGVIVDMANNSNPNTIPQGELDPNIGRS